MEIKIEKAKNLKQLPDEDNLQFGKEYSDHMFVMEYDSEIGWHNAKIMPYGPIQLDPTSLVLHYGQETFEGMKAYRTDDGSVLLFRPEENAKRFQTSNRRLCMPEIEVDDFVEAVESLVKIDENWVPRKEGTSLYLRPFMFATESGVGVKPSSKYLFMVVASPVGAYYKEGVKPVKIWVEDTYTRATQGGTGFAKCGGNYAASLIAQQQAQEKGYTQVLWLDGMERKYVEEVGTMNAMFVIDDYVLTAPINGTVLPGITRDSVIQLLKDWGITVKEEYIHIDDLMAFAKDGRLKEAFGTGTAALISPIGELNYKENPVVINNFEIGEITQRLYDTLTDIQYGKIEDEHSWTYKVGK